MHRRFTLLSFLATTLVAEIPYPTDAPKPLSQGESAAAFQLPEGMKIRLLASEPLITEPSGVCWDEHGRFFVCELHGYNVEGQYDIDELNKTGELDLEVRRIQASEQSKKRAEADTYGTVKLLRDTDGDGVMDRAEVWADRLPPCYGIAPGNGGIVVACAPDIVFLKDTDGDDRPDVKEKLFTGFGTGALERGINAPTWGVDNWLYFGRGWSGGAITGPHLAKPVTLPSSDFRIRADGSAIEPVSGSTKTIGMAITAGGDRFVATTTYPGLFVTPIPWRYLERNPDAAAPVLDSPATDDTRVHPVAPVHPWRIKREQHAEYFAFYRKISLSDAAASGYFTSACGPLVYQDHVLPGLHGHHLVCEPAQNLVHRSGIVRDGTRLRLVRVSGEENREFLASRDSWFHPMSLAHTPDGSLAIVDFYREIIEDYSAIPRHLQQQYGVIHGRDRGRIWLLEPENVGGAKQASRNLAPLSDEALLKELESPLYWRRRTAQRLLDERGKLPARYLSRGWESQDVDARVAALRAADEDSFQNSPEILAEVLRVAGSAEVPPSLALQMALSLGQIEPARARDALLSLARENGGLRWMDAAVASSAKGVEKELLAALAGQPGRSEPVMVNLAGILAARGDAAEIKASIAAMEAVSYRGKALEVLRLGLEGMQPLATKMEMPAPVAPSAGELAKVEKRMPEFTEALKAKPDIENGKALFTGVCGVCHRSQGVGVAVGPDLDAEFQRAPEVILRDVLFPHEAMRPGYETVMAKTQRGETLVGIAASDSPTSITLRIAGGAERTVLRKRASISTVRNASLMPGTFAEALQPKQLADIIAYLRQPR